MIQPAAKYAKSAVRSIGTAESYYTVNADGKVTTLNTQEETRTEGSNTDTFFNTTFRYTQSHDSIVKINKAGGVYMEYELPVLIKYNLTAKAAVYGGVNIVYSKMKGVAEHTYTQAGIVRSVDTLIKGSVRKTMPVAPPLDDMITYSGTTFSDYNGPLYPATQANQVRLGAMLGFSYECSDRWLLDALIQQNPAPKDMRGGYNLNAPLSSTYFRLSVGYKLTK
jgi:hypothetical protein